MRLAIVIPALNEQEHIEAALRELAALRARGVRVIVVDGGSTDSTVPLAAALADRVITAPRGRAQQLNAGASLALSEHADTLLFLHTDTRLPDRADQLIARACGSPYSWGRFDVRIDGRSPALPIVAALMNLRSRLTGICTGDQAIFATRALLEAAGGFAVLPLMEDIDFSRRARRTAWPVAVRPPAVTSGRRWDRHGVVRTVLLMWRLRLAYFLGADPARLAVTYRDVR